MKRGLLFLMIFALAGCGVMNQHDKDAAVAHAQAQQAVMKAWLDAQNKPACTVDIPAGKEFPGIKVVCNSSGSGAVPVVAQYNQPESPWKPLIAGAGHALSAAPMAIVGGIGLGVMGKMAENAASKSITNSISGTGNTIKMAGPTNINGVVTNSTVGGLVENATATPTVVFQPPPVIVEQPAPVIVTTAP